MKLVIVEWDDTYADVGWSDNDMEPVAIKSVGWLVQKDKKKLVLAGMIGSAGLTDFNCRQAIPRGCIKSIMTLPYARTDGTCR